MRSPNNSSLDQQQPEEPGAVAFVIEGRRAALARLGATALVGGTLEALFLVLVVRTAFAITDDAETVTLAGERSTSIGTALLLAFALVLSRLVCAVAASWQGAVLNSAVVADLRERVAGAFMHASWEVQQSQRAGSLQELLTTYSSEAARLTSGASLVVASSGNLIALLAVAIVIDPLSALILLAAMAALGSILRPLRKAVRRGSFDHALASMNFSTSLAETSQLGQELHVFHVQRQAEEHVGELIQRNRRLAQRVTFLSGLVTPVYTVIAYLGIVGALTVVAASNSTNLTTLGAAMLVMLRSLGYGLALQNAYTSITGARPSIEELQRRLGYFDAHRRREGGDRVGEVGAIEATNVSFSYADGRRVLSDLSFSVPTHGVVGIVGPSGSGKSTLVQLLLGLRQPDAGSISAGGRNIGSFARGEWARQVTFVPQAARIITGTIADNVRFYRDDIGDDDIERACRLAHFHEDVTAFPDGYGRELGAEAAQLSGGQQQRLTIARALVGRPDVLILDEPTSALDGRSEQLIRATLRELSEVMTVVIIAHRLSTLDICDRIMVIRDGVLEAYDTPAALATDNEFFIDALASSEPTPGGPDDA